LLTDRLAYDVKMFFDSVKSQFIFFYNFCKLFRIVPDSSKCYEWIEEQN